MTLTLDHMILAVNDLAASIRFYTEVMGLEHEGEREPFSVIRVSPDLVLLLAPWGTGGGEHLAFSMTAAEFDAVFARAKAAGVAYGFPFHDVGNNAGPGPEFGAAGDGSALYFYDPDKHLIEIRHYEAVAAPG
jgi:catechol 2,3-dioxygenase-like lactoylglutathione lyase family enzyme